MDIITTTTTTTTTTVIPNTTHIPPPHGFAMGGKITLTAVAVLFTVSLLVLFIHLYLRWHLHPRQSLRRFNGRRREQPVITVPRGLDPKVLNSLPTLAVSSSHDVADCAVCLTEFNNGEVVRVLPPCDHRFHVECIEMWFGSHNSCPLCRSAVELPPSPAAAVAIESSSESGSGDVIRIQIRDGEEPESGLGLGSGSGSEEKSRLLAILRLLSRREVDRS